MRRPRTRGVKCLVRHGDRVVFVRHAYGDRSGWELPGGGVRRGEPPEEAARREAREELGLDLGPWTRAAELEIAGLGKRTRLYVLAAVAPTDRLDVRLAELEEARWAPLDAPPRPLRRDAVAVLAAVRRGGG